MDKLIEKAAKVYEKTGKIAESLGISERYVHAVLQYEKCIYNSENRTENAKRIEKCRKGKNA